MSCPRAAARAARLITPLLLVSASAWPAGAPTAADLARCAAMTAPDARLACYDSLSAPPAPAANPAPAAPATPTASAPALPPPASTATTTVTNAVPAPATNPAPAVPAPAAATSVAAPAPTGNAASPAASVDDPQNFGFTRAQVQAHSQSPPPPGLQSIQVHLANVLTDRQGNGYVLLDNGQIWTYQGDDGRMRPGEPVTIKRASLGSYIMVTQSKRSYHVTRQR
jgi:hypothetical protein